MKSFLSFLFFITLIISSCKKDNEITYYLQADINGVSETFSKNAYAQEYFGDVIASFGVNGENSAQHHQLLISISHNYDTTVTDGTYDRNSVNENFYPGVSFTKNDTLYYGSGVKPDNPYPVSITVSEVTSKTSKGTFNAIVYNPYNPSDSIVITNGKFYVAYRR